MGLIYLSYFPLLAIFFWDEFILLTDICCWLNKSQVEREVHEQCSVSEFLLYSSWWSSIHLPCFLTRVNFDEWSLPFLWRSSHLVVWGKHSGVAFWNILFASDNFLLNLLGSVNGTLIIWWWHLAASLWDLASLSTVRYVTTYSSLFFPLPAVGICYQFSFYCFSLIFPQSYHLVIVILNEVQKGENIIICMYKTCHN